MIRDIKVFTKSISLDMPFPTSYGEDQETEHLFVIISDSDGIEGYGEASALLEFTGENRFTMKYILKTVFIPNLIGKEVEEAYSSYWNISKKLPNNPAAKKAIEIALLDLWAKKLDVPFYTLLGYEFNSEVEMCYAIGAVTPQEAVAYAREGRNRGFRYFKLKANGKIKEDIARINAVLDVLDEDCKVRVDANCGWENYRTTMKILKNINNIEMIEYIEQPVGRGDLRELKKIKENSPVPVFADESVFSPADAINLASSECVDGFCIKMAKCGGPKKAKLIADIAELYDLKATVVSAFDTVLGGMADLHLSATIPNLSSSCEIFPTFLKEDFISEEEYKKVSPKIRVPEKSGLGVRLDVKRLKEGSDI